MGAPADRDGGSDFERHQTVEQSLNRWIRSFLFGQFLGGLTAAMFLFLIASGLSLIFGILRILNFAHGSFYMIGAYLAWQIVQSSAPATGSFWIAVLASALAVALLGALIERFLLLHGSTAAKNSISCCSPTPWCWSWPTPPR